MSSRNSVQSLGWFCNGGRNYILFSWSNPRLVLFHSSRFSKSPAPPRNSPMVFAEITHGIVYAVNVVIRVKDVVIITQLED